MKISKTVLVTFIATLAAAATSAACDLCGCYTCPLDVVHEKPFAFYAGVAEQFTDFGTERLDGVKQPNPAGEYIESSITQFVIGTSFLNNRLGVQLNVPLIYRSFQRQTGFGIENGHVSGLGDITLTANAILLKKEAFFHNDTAPMSKDAKAVAEPPQSGGPDFTATVNFTAGIKLPTGDTSQLRQNYLPEIPGAPASGIGPHDLTLGTGSVDGVFGLEAEMRYKAAYFQTEVHYTWRDAGAYQYRFANDLQWSGGPGLYLYRKGGSSLCLQCVLSGETKGYDTFQGVSDSDSSITALYAGPRITAAIGRVNGEIGLDLPVIMHATGFQTVPDYRIRAGFSIHF